ncbi:hypothetical protein BDC45DRAFT_511429 [Circinella umbellata]|nr:hypothetical protein BDC45DRAFT_511429 [Circinella umbellata]
MSYVYPVFFLCIFLATSLLFVKETFYIYAWLLCRKLVHKNTNKPFLLLFLPCGKTLQTFYLCINSCILVFLYSTYITRQSCFACYCA